MSACFTSRHAIIKGTCRLGIKSVLVLGVCLMHAKVPLWGGNPNAFLKQRTFLFVQSSTSHCVCVNMRRNRSVQGCHGSFVCNVIEDTMLHWSRVEKKREETWHQVACANDLQKKTAKGLGSRGIEPRSFEPQSSVLPTKL